MSSAAPDHAHVAPQHPTAASTVSDSVASTIVPARAPGSKLRDCCQSCARSKVRCTKEKPSCSRCETKGIPCRYLQSKRPGRIPGSGARRLNPAAHSNDGPRNRVVVAAVDASSLASSTPRRESDTADAAAESRQSPSTAPVVANVALDGPHRRVDSLFDTNYGVFDALGLNASVDMDFEGDLSVPFVWDDCFDALATMEDPMYTNLMDWDQTTGALGTNLSLVPGPGDGASVGSGVSQLPADCLLPADLHVPSTSQPEGDSDTLVSTANSSKSSSSTSLASSASSYSPFMDRLSLSAANISTTRPTSFPPTRKSTQSASPQRADQDSTCHCLPKALDLMKAVTTEDPHPEPSGTSGAIGAQAILAKNKETIQATLSLMACNNCQDDRFLLMVALLIAMKMLPRYASAAVSCQPQSRTEAVTESSGCSSSISSATNGMSNQHTPRHAKQQVLRELHLVHRLITQLSSRLKGLSEGGQQTSHTTNSLMETRAALPYRLNINASQRSRTMSNSSSMESGSGSPMPISTRALDLVGDDVRNSLSSLSAVVRNALKDS